MILILAVLTPDNDLGQDASPSSISPFFPPSTPQTLSLPAFLNTLSNLLTPFSSQMELVNAFAAFDDDDSGQIDVSELRDALLNTSPELGERMMGELEVDRVLGEFVGKRAFGKGLGNGSRADVFRYNEFLGSVMGSGETMTVERNAETR